MSLFLGILLAVLVFLLVVLVHEFGHFFTARLSKMRVEEFGFGLPPRAFSLGKDKKGTEYTWNWLPIGGFVRIYGEDPTGEDAYNEGAFMSRPWIQRVIVLIAGVMMNFLLAFFIFTGLFLYGTKPVAINPLTDGPTHSFFLPSFDEALELGFVKYDGIEISSITGSIAELSGIGRSEEVLRVNGYIVTSPEEFISLVRTSTGTLSLTLKNSGTERVIHVTPVDSKIGVQVDYRNLQLSEDYILKLGLIDATKKGAIETYNSSVMTLSFLGKLVRGIFVPETPQEREDAKNMLSGPIGVGATFVGLIEISAPVGLIFVVIALISINLAVFNLLPIPALDGGRIVTTTLYSLIVRYAHAGKDRFLQYEKYFHAIGFILLIILTLYVAGMDISRFF